MRTSAGSTTCVRRSSRVAISARTVCRCPNRPPAPGRGWPEHPAPSSPAGCRPAVPDRCPPARPAHPRPPAVAHRCRPAVPAHRRRPVAGRRCRPLAPAHRPVRVGVGRCHHPGRRQQSQRPHLVPCRRCRLLARCRPPVPGDGHRRLLVLRCRRRVVACRQLPVVRCRPRPAVARRRLQVLRCRPRARPGTRRHHPVGPSRPRRHVRAGRSRRAGARRRNRTVVHRPRPRRAGERPSHPAPDRWTVPGLASRRPARPPVHRTPAGPGQRPPRCRHRVPDPGHRLPPGSSRWRLRTRRRPGTMRPAPRTPRPLAGRRPTRRHPPAGRVPAHPPNRSPVRRPVLRPDRQAAQEPVAHAPDAAGHPRSISRWCRCPATRRRFPVCRPAPPSYRTAEREDAMAAVARRRNRRCRRVATGPRRRHLSTVGRRRR